MSSSTQLEQIQKKRAELENELRSLEEKEKDLEASVKIVEEKRIVEDLEEKVKAKRAVVEKLESKKRELEKKLGEPQKKEPMEVIVESVADGDHQEKEEILPALLEKMK